MSKTTYIKIQGKKFAVKTRDIKTSSNYNTGISVHNIGEKLPICGTIIKANDDPKTIAKSLIDNLSERTILTQPKTHKICQANVT